MASRSKKKRAGQSVHKSHERPLIPTGQCDGAQPLRPAGCGRCAGKLSGSGPEPLRRPAEFLSSLLGQPCRAALTVKMEAQGTAALRSSREELAGHLPTNNAAVEARLARPPAPSLVSGA